VTSARSYNKNEKHTNTNRTNKYMVKKDKNYAKIENLQNDK